jgi:hypothetical protein
MWLARNLLKDLHIDVASKRASSKGLDLGPGH